jgi:WD40-like Beta Propeller Repeat
VIRGIDPDAEDRVLVEHGIDDTSIAWSPDGQRLLVATVPEIVGTIQTELVDIEHGVMYPLPAPGMAVFLSSSEVAVTSYRQRSIAILPLGEHAATIARCDVPGDYKFVRSLEAMRDGSMIVRTQNGDTGTLVRLARDCRVLATFSTARLASIAASDTETAVALVQGDGFGEILEISRAGAVLSRRRVIAEIWDLLGRHQGVDYLLTVAQKTRLDRVHGAAPPVPQFSSTGVTTFALAPDGHTLARIELGTRNRPRGPLRLSPVEGLALRGRPLLGNAVMTSWSPDGRSLATLVDDAGGVAVVIVDRAGGATRRLPLQDLNGTAPPVWLDDHRVAAQTADRTTYLWLDLVTGEHGELVDRAHGSTCWLARSPRDGTLAMWRDGTPDGTDPGTGHLWLVVPGHEAALVHVGGAAKYHLLPSWSPGGELLVQALETGAVSRVALDTGELTPVTQLAPISMMAGYADPLMTLPDGDLLATQTELGLNVSLVRVE